MNHIRRKLISAMFSMPSILATIRGTVVNIKKSIRLNHTRFIPGICKGENACHILANHLREKSIKGLPF